MRVPLLALLVVLLASPALADSDEDLARCIEEIEARGPKLFQALAEVGKLGAKAAPAIPALEGLIGHRDHRIGLYHAAIRRLGDIGTAALPALRRAARNKDWCGMVAAEAAGQLARFGPAAKEAVPDLEPLLGWHPPCYAAAAALSRMGPDGFAALKRALFGDNALARDQAARVISAHGEEGLAVLLKALASEDAGIRAGALSVLGGYGPPDPDAWEHSVPPPPDSPAPPGVEPFPLPPGPAKGVTERVIEAVLATAGDPDAEVRARVLLALYWLDPEAARCREMFLAGLTDADPRVRKNAAAALPWIDPTEEEVPRIAAGLSLEVDLLANRHEVRHPDGVVSVSIEALSEFTLALRDLGPKAAAATPVLIRLMKELGLEMARSTSAETLALIGGEEAATAVLDLFERVRGDDDWTRRNVIRALGLLGAEAAPAVSRLIEIIAEGDWPAVEVQALSRIGPLPPSAIPALVRVLSLRRPDRLGGSYAGPSGPPPGRYWPPERRSRETSADDPRAVAGDLLVALAPGSIPALRKAAQAEDPRLAERAGKLLEAASRAKKDD